YCGLFGMDVLAVRAANPTRIALGLLLRCLMASNPGLKFYSIHKKDTESRMQSEPPIKNSSSCWDGSCICFLTPLPQNAAAGHFAVFRGKSRERSYERKTREARRSPTVAEG